MGIENDRKLVVNCLPLTEAERCAVSARWLEANDAITLEEDAGWTLIA